jgi:hypothetical protein
LPSPVANPSAMSEPSENEAENLIPGPAETGKVNRLATSKTLNIERILFFMYFLIDLELILKSVNREYALLAAIDTSDSGGITYQLSHKQSSLLQGSEK